MTETPANDTGDTAIASIPPRPTQAVTVSKSSTHAATGVIDSNPLPILVGGLAIGALVAAMLPATAREGKLLGPLGKRLTDTAAGAAQAARDAGKAELDALGLNRDAARNQAGKLFEGVLKAMSTAGSAAVTATKAKD